MLRHLQRVSCLFFGHQYWLGRGSDRLFLKCAACGHETAGVQVGADDTGPRKGKWRRIFGGRASSRGPGKPDGREPSPVTVHHRR